MDLPQIKIGNNLLGSALVNSIQVTQELNRHWTCTVSCRQGVGERISIEDMLGQPVVVTGIGEDKDELPMLTGFVLSAELVYESAGAFSAQIVAVSNSYKMDVAPRKQYYDDKSLAEIAGMLGPNAGLKVGVSAPAQKKLNYVQYGETDFSFLNRIVDDYGAWMRPSATGLEVFAAFQPGCKVAWRDKADLVDFKISGTLAPASFNGVHYDHHAMMSETFTAVTKKPQFYDKGAEALVASVSAESKTVLPSGFLFDRSRVMENETFKETLEDEAERSIGGSIFGVGHTRNPAMMPGNEVTIEGPMDAAGTYGVIKVVHQWNSSGYGNSFVCTPWKNYRNPRAPEVRTWQGVVPARVVAHNDPKKMGRVKVQFFWQDQNSTHWARTTSPHAGPDRGFMFMPEVGDEVAIAFEDGDPERPLIIGSVWNGVQTQYRGDFRGGDIEGNDVKHLMTKSGNRLHLSDKKGVETVVLATPHNNRIKMTERSDQTGRVNITIESLTGDIVLHAPKGRVHIESMFYSKDVGGE